MNFGFFITIIFLLLAIYGAFINIKRAQEVFNQEKTEYIITPRECLDEKSTGCYSIQRVYGEE